jgi:hypothetical protein
MSRGQKIKKRLNYYSMEAKTIIVQSSKSKLNVYFEKEFLFYFVCYAPYYFLIQIVCLIIEGCMHLTKQYFEADFTTIDI